MTFLKSDIQKKPRVMLMNNYHTLVRTVLVEKIPFKVYIGDSTYVVKNCVSIKELLNGLTKGMDSENKKKYTQKYLKNNFRPTDFYIVIKGFTNKDKGIVLPKSHCIKITTKN